MKVLITGANGFIGKNLNAHLAERADVEVVNFTRANSVSELPAMLPGVEFVFHLAGANRPADQKEFEVCNTDLTRGLCASLQACRSFAPIVFSSSIQASRETPYGLSKLAAEHALVEHGQRTGVPVHIFRLPNVFGKWCKPSYNSVVATFCHNIARDLPIRVDDPSSALRLVYIDDLVERFIQLMDGATSTRNHEGCEINPQEYTTTVGLLGEKISAFKASRSTITTERVGRGLTRALYSTYVSYLPTDRFSYDLPRHCDSRGVFVEMLKTPDCGQFSYFTAGPGVVRGGHYHHSKSEKFLVLKGKARFRFKDLNSGRAHEIVVDESVARIVETVPGWSHDITNIGSSELVVMLWANEIFDREKPDTFSSPL